MHLNNKQFVTAYNKNGLSSNETIFFYLEKENIITATYKGGSIIQGSILGKRIDKSNKISLIYQCITTDGELKAGESKGTITQDKNGKIVLDFDWNWLNGDLSGGTSRYIEID